MEEVGCMENGNGKGRTPLSLFDAKIHALKSPEVIRNNISPPCVRRQKSYYMYFSFFSSACLKEFWLYLFSSFPSFCPALRDW